MFSNISLTSAAILYDKSKHILNYTILVTFTGLPNIILASFRYTHNTVKLK